MIRFKSSCKMPNRRKINLALLALAILLALVWFSPRSHASDNAPGLAPRRCRGNASRVSEGRRRRRSARRYPNHGEGQWRDRNHPPLAYKLLRPEAREDYGYALVEFDNQTKISSFKAWTILPNGTQIAVKDKEATEVGLADDELFSDYRAKIIRFPEANRRQHRRLRIHSTPPSFRL